MCISAGEAGDADELLRLVDADPPDVAVIDIRMPPTNTDEGLRAAQDIRSRHPGVAVLLLSQYVEASSAVRLLAEGARSFGYLLKDRGADVGELGEAIRRVAKGEVVIDSEVVRQLLRRQREGNPMAGLTERERQVLALMAEGRSNEAISAALFLGIKTVETYVNRIFSKLGLVPTADDHRRVLAVLTYLRA